MIEFASIAYGNRERWYLAGGSGQSAEKKCWAFVWGIICQKGTTKCGAVAQFVPVMILPLFLSLS